MPVLPSSYVSPPWFYFNAHVETVLPSVFRKVLGVNYSREKIDTPDGDFLNLDWSRVGGERLLIVSHGLEGDSQRHYARALVKLFNQQGIDGLVWNNRSCGGEGEVRARWLERRTRWRKTPGACSVLTKAFGAAARPRHGEGDVRTPAPSDSVTA